MNHPVPVHVDAARRVGVDDATSIELATAVPDGPLVDDAGQVHTAGEAARGEQLQLARGRAARILPAGIDLDDVEVHEGDWLLGAATRLLLDHLGLLQVAADVTADVDGELVDVASAIADGGATRHQLQTLHEEITRLRAGAAETAGDPHDVPTPEEWIAGFLRLDGPGRIRHVQWITEQHGQAVRCFEMAHDARIADLTRALAAARAEPQPRGLTTTGAEAAG